MALGIIPAIFGMLLSAQSLFHEPVINDQSIQSTFNTLVNKSEKGSSLDSFLVGCFYEFKNKDRNSAFEWYLKAKEQNPSENLKNDIFSTLGNFYELGLGVENDQEKALFWYTKTECLKGTREVNPKTLYCYTGIEQYLMRRRFCLRWFVYHNIISKKEYEEL